MSPKKKARAKLFHAMKRKPTAFDPFHGIAPRAAIDPKLSSKTGPKLKTVQWEPTWRVRETKKNATA